LRSISPRGQATLPVIMPLFALTTLEKLQQVPPRTWWLIAAGVGAFFLVVVLIRLAGQVNKFLLGGIVVIVVFVVGMEWVYDRNEPAWATPFVDALASSGFLPTAGKPAPKPGDKTPPPGH
jgi:amino acid transporter